MEIETDQEDVLLSQFENCPHKRTLHSYEDEVRVEILITEDPKFAKINGSRIFYKDKKSPLCKFPGYNIEKFVVQTNERNVDYNTTEAGIQEITAKIPEGFLCLTNDGPLILVFKVLGKVRLHMMRTAKHEFTEQFSRSFSEQYPNQGFDQLFPEDQDTSDSCFMFRSGEKSSAMLPAKQGLLFIGTVHCQLFQEDVSVKAPLVLPEMLTLSLHNATNMLREIEGGLVCFRHEFGEIQIISEIYLKRIATWTGVSMDELITGESDDLKVVGMRPLMFQKSPHVLSVPLNSSKYPRLLDLFGLYVLCGVNSGKLVCGFTATLDTSGARDMIMAAPKKGFYNFCRTAGVTVRKQLRFPATLNSIRYSVRNLMIHSALESKKQELKDMFEKFDNLIYNLAPMFMTRMLQDLKAFDEVFERAMGFKIGEFVKLDRRRAHMKHVRTEMMLGNQYYLMIVSRFCSRYLIEQSPITIPKAILLGYLEEYSKSTRKRREISEKVVAERHVEDDDMNFWPLPGE
jgi:hypothetical protein